MRSILLAFAATLALTLPAKADDVTVAVTAIVEHPALDAARNGVRDALAAAGYKEGENLKFVFESAQGNPATAAQIARQFAGDEPNVIVPISTPSPWISHSSPVSPAATRMGSRPARLSREDPGGARLCFGSRPLERDGGEPGDCVP